MEEWYVVRDSAGNIVVRTNVCIVAERYADKVGGTVEDHGSTMHHGKVIYRAQPKPGVNMSEPMEDPAIEEQARNAYIAHTSAFGNEPGEWDYLDDDVKEGWRNVIRRMRKLAGE